VAALGRDLEAVDHSPPLADPVHKLDFDDDLASAKPEADSDAFTAVAGRLAADASSVRSSYG